MYKMMTAIALAAALSIGLLGAVTAAHADHHTGQVKEYDGYPDWANDAFYPKGPNR